MSVSTYELKPYAQARNLAGVYEASAHQRRAHLSSLVIEWPLDEEHEPPSAVVAECQRLGVGLVRMWETNAERLIEPTPQRPLAAELNDFLSDIITVEQTPRYLDAIGRHDELTDGEDEKV